MKDDDINNNDEGWIQRKWGGKERSTERRKRERKRVLREQKGERGKKYKVMCKIKIDKLNGEEEINRKQEGEERRGERSN